MYIELLKAFILGVIQGITEWLPVSSTGHMILFDYWFPLAFTKNFVNLFLVLIQLGSILAVVLLFSKIINPFRKDISKLQRNQTFVLWEKIIIASVPAAIVGFIFDDLIDSYFYNPLTIASMLVIYGLLFIYVERQKSSPRLNSLKDITYIDALLMGVFQTFALIPGTSRSGATILGGLWLGASRVVAAEFSFLMAIPVMFGASFLKLIRAGFVWSPLQWSVLAIGFVTAFVVSLVVIRFLMAYVRKHSFKVFAYYRFVLAGLVFLLLLIGR